MSFWKENKPAIIIMIISLIVGAIISVVFFRLSQERVDIRAEIASFPLVVSTHNPALDDSLHLVLDGEEIKANAAKYTLITFKNKGKKPLSSDDISKEHPLTLKISGDVYYVGVNKNKTSEGIGAKTTERELENEYQLDFQYLSHNEQVAVSIIHSPQAKISYSIKGKEINKIKRSISNILTYKVIYIGVGNPNIAYVIFLVIFFGGLSLLGAIFVLWTVFKILNFFATVMMEHSNGNCKGGATEKLTIFMEKFNKFIDKFRG